MRRHTDSCEQEVNLLRGPAFKGVFTELDEDNNGMISGAEWIVRLCGHLCLDSHGAVTGILAKAPKEPWQSQIHVRFGRLHQRERRYTPPRVHCFLLSCVLRLRGWLHAAGQDDQRCI